MKLQPTGLLKLARVTQALELSPDLHYSLLPWALFILPQSLPVRVLGLQPWSSMIGIDYIMEILR